MEYGTLDGDEVNDLFKGKRPDRPDDTPTGPTCCAGDQEEAEVRRGLWRRGA